MKHAKSPRALLPLLTALLLFPATDAFSQAGGGSKGGVVQACFTSDPTKFMEESEWSKFVQAEVDAACQDNSDSRKCKERPQKIYTWPVVTEDPTDPRIGYASRAIVWDAVNRLKYVQVAEYYLATTFRSWGGTEDTFGNGTYRLHPLLYALNDLPISKKAVPEPALLAVGSFEGASIAFPKEKLYNPMLLTASEEEILFQYVESEESRLQKDKGENTPIFAQMYGLVANMFRGVPAFYTRLQAAHERLGLIPNHESNTWGSSSNQWDSTNLSALTSLPTPPGNCLWMTAADRIGDHIIYDRYLWQRMDLFQRVILQLHEEIYYMGSDATALGLAQNNVEPTRFILSRFLRGERKSNDLSGDFANECAYYDTSGGRRNPTVRLRESSACQVGGSIERSPIKGNDANFLPQARIGSDTTAFLSQFICPADFACSPELMRMWEKIARYYGPYSSGALQALLANEKVLDDGQKLFFGRYSTIDRLVEKRDRAWQIVTWMLQPYETLWSFCDKAGYASAYDLSGPPPPPNNPRRLERREREAIAKRQREREKKGDYSPRPGEPIVKASDLEEIAVENRVFRDLRRAGSSIELQRFSQDLGLLEDFPDQFLSGPVANLVSLKVPASFADVTDLEPGSRGRNEGALARVCEDVRKRRKELSDFLRQTGTPLVPNMTFYELPFENPLDLKVPR